MALKDWKRKINNDGNTYFQNRNLKILIFKNSRNLWVLTPFGFTYFFPDRSFMMFKSKSQALKFAKSYMRRH